MTKYIPAIILGIFLTCICLLADAKTESEYQESCEGVKEYVLPDRTRVDCLTNWYAIEYDFARKWAEAIGQSLHYARITGKRAKIRLIIEKQQDKRYYNILMDNIQYYGLPIDVEKVE